MEPKALYKYLPSRYVSNVLENGELLFWNLSYFKQHECEKRGDPLEGHHRDNPDNDIVIDNLSTGSKIKGDFSFLNSTNSDLIYVFCLSQSLCNDLFEEFESNACIEIIDVKEFIRRVRVAVKRLVSVHKTGLLNAPVSYYVANKPAEFNVKDPKKLVFAKDDVFSNQDEYRLVFGTRKAFDLEQSIVINGAYNFREEAMKGVVKEKMIKIGKITDIANVKYINT